MGGKASTVDKLFTESPINLMTRRPSLTRLRSCEWPLHRNADVEAPIEVVPDNTPSGAPISFSVIHDRELTQRNPISFELVCALSTTVDGAKLPSRLR